MVMYCMLLFRVMLPSVGPTSISEIVTLSRKMD